MVRLLTVTRDALTIARRRRGKGYCYVDATGKVLRDDALRARARMLAIPPAWEDVRIAPHPRAHIQACGRDAAGRVQYIYHPQWEEQRQARKHSQLTLLATALPSVRRRVARDLSAEAGTPALALAIAVALIDRTAMRIGRERYLKSSGTRGAGTLFVRDVRVRGSSVSLDFPAKSGKKVQYRFADRRLAEAIARIKTLTGKRLLVYHDEGGATRAITSEMINSYLEDAAKAHVTAKDFRTLHASSLAGEALAAIAPAASVSARKRQITAVTRQVAEFLHNTPAISRKSYIAPCLFRLFDDGALQLLWTRNSGGTSGLRRREQRLERVLTVAG